MRSAWRRAGYRVRQFLDGIYAPLEVADIAEVRDVLGNTGVALFVAMAPRDRKHSLEVMRWLRRSGEAAGEAPSHDLLAAALLHDVGKGRIWVWDRVLFVLLDALPRVVSARIEAPAGMRWRRAQWTLRHHARLGAARLESAGVAPRVVALVLGHTGAAGRDHELAWLIEADRHC